MSDHPSNHDPRVQQIMREERAKTTQAIADLAVAGQPVPEQVKHDVRQLWRHIQVAVNVYMEDVDRPVDALVLQATMRLMLDEHDRVYGRMRAAGLLPE